MHHACHHTALLSQDCHDSVTCQDCDVSRACDVAEGEVGDDPLLAIPPQVELGELPGGEHDVVVGEHGALAHSVSHV